MSSEENRRSTSTYSPYSTLKNKMGKGKTQKKGLKAALASYQVRSAERTHQQAMVENSKKAAEQKGKVKKKDKGKGEYIATQGADDENIKVRKRFVIPFEVEDHVLLVGEGKLGTHNHFTLYTLSYLPKETSHSHHRYFLLDSDTSPSPSQRLRTTQRQNAYENIQMMRSTISHCFARKGSRFYLEWMRGSLGK